MSLNEKAKKKVKKKIGKYIRRITFIVIKPFLPLIIVIVGIILAISAVSDSIFGKDDTGDIEKLLESEDYEAVYAEWLEMSNPLGGIITDGSHLVPKGMFIWPVPGFTDITSPFGMRTHPITYEYKMHTGVDVAAPIGADFVAMADGKVTTAKYTWGYGNCVMIEHR